MSYDDLVKYGSEKAVKKQDAWKKEKRICCPRRGGIVEFRFNV